MKCASAKSRVKCEIIVSIPLKYGSARNVLQAVTGYSLALFSCRFSLADEAVHVSSCRAPLVLHFRAWIKTFKVYFFSSEVVPTDLGSRFCLLVSLEKGFFPRGSFPTFLFLQYFNLTSHVIT